MTGLGGSPQDRLDATLDALADRRGPPGRTATVPTALTMDTDCWRCEDCGELHETLPRDEDAIQSRCHNCGEQRTFKRADAPWEDTDE